ncbi:hypothetical protein CEUSTIGMA_g190.t1 [Chlamydomonas eustigma]|uniref:Uncharacterized protein n=1 Tax=Chlamydomonas eustigma TaxID=1157962 RepID=A0A250WPG2_9CHLO|nr:hypothetical protein CEUSTIGMA_g190.t1 [Chlamydomonas eustigma]|eukprot:GAX72734.1 hypothetical protein CEUSTIGMA_g190.t1 [Chlamydomonas eustigma]
MVVTRDGELGRQLRKLQRYSRQMQHVSTSGNRLVQPEDSKGYTPGEKLGYSLEVQIAAAGAAAKIVGVKAPKAFESSDSLDPNKAAEAEVVALASAQGNKNKYAESLQRDVLGLNWKLLISAHSVRMHLTDLLQRRLASYLPASSSFPEGDAQQSQREWSALRCRCAILKGQHQVSYRGYSSATTLLRFLAEENRSGIKMVMKLPPATAERFEPPCIASTSGCHGNLLLSFDVRGSVLPPREVLNVPVDIEPGLFTAAPIVESLLTSWDTFGFRVPVKERLESLPAQSEPDAVPTPMFQFPPPPDVFPPGSEAGLALAVCGHAMQALHDVGKRACLMVQWDKGSDSVISRPREDFVRLTLAELDLSEQGRGLWLKNSPGVVHEVLVEEGKAKADTRNALSRRIGALLAGVSNINAHYNTSLQETAFDDLRDSYVQSVNKRFDEEVLTRDAIFNMIGSTEFDDDSLFN